MPTAATPPTTTTAIPDGLEIFRAGRRTARDGRVYEITPADIATAAAAYDPTLSEAPLVIGHPEHNKPSYGWVSALHVDGDVLQSDHHQVDPAFAQYFAAGRVKKRSAAFYHPQDPANPKPGVWYLRHVGFLGAIPPAVKGLRDPQFSEGDTEFGLVLFSDPDPQEQSDMSKELQEQLDAEKKARAAAEAANTATKQQLAAAQAATIEADKKLAEFAEAQKTARHDAHVSFAEARIQDGKLLPKDKAMLVATLDQLAVAEPVEFSEGDTTRKVSPAQWLQDLVSAGAPQVDFSERGGGDLSTARGAAKGQSDAEVDKKARAYMGQHKVSYVEAVRAVTAG
ncbi:Phage protein [plant metagenome]|uniref:Phage protein n=1 Tax=plant metagenome TaxID=1297885 RepID=A0A484UNS2_9ZZZZ